MNPEMCELAKINIANNSIEHIAPGDPDPDVQVLRREAARFLTRVLTETPAKDKE